MNPINMKHFESSISETAGELRELIRRANKSEELRILFPLYWLKSNPGLSSHNICQSLNIELSDLFNLMSDYHAHGLDYLINTKPQNTEMTTLKRNVARHRQNIFPQLPNLQSLGELAEVMEKEDSVRYNEMHSMFQQCFGIPFHRAVRRLKEDSRFVEHRSGL